MIGSHVAWVFVALLLGVCIGWLTYKRGRARLLDAIIWVIIGLIIAAPILLPDLPAAVTPLGTLVALFYFVGCPIGWSWRHGAIVEHRCAETDAPGYVYRGAASPPRWQSVSQQQDARATPIAGAAKIEAAGVPQTAPPPAVPTTATAHAVPSDGKESSPSTAAATGANAGVATAPASFVTAPAVAEQLSPPPATPDGAQTGSNAGVSPSPSAHGSATGSAGNPLPAAGPADAADGPTPSASPDPIANTSTPSRTDAPAPALQSTSAPDETQTSTPEPAQGQTAQTSLDFAPAPAADIVAGKVEPQTTPVSAHASDPPASAPVLDQDKHAGVRPPGFVTAREDKPDDLQLIRGIGPQNEGRLHGLGIWHFDQIGAWTAEEVRWVGSYLAFPGRIDREKWVDQAREIASGAIIPKAAARRATRPR